MHFSDFLGLSSCPPPQLWLQQRRGREGGRRALCSELGGGTVGGGAARGSPTGMVSGLGSARFSFPSREFAAGIFFPPFEKLQCPLLVFPEREAVRQARAEPSKSGRGRNVEGCGPRRRASPRPTADGRGRAGARFEGAGRGPARPSSLPTPEGPPGPGAAPKGVWSGEAAERAGHGGGMGLSRRAACCAGLLLAAVVAAGAGLLLRFLDRPRCDPPRYWHAAVAADTRRCSEVGR